jgi:hypothetical protein
MSWLSWLTPLTTICQLYRGGQLYWLGKAEKTTDRPQVTDKHGTKCILYICLLPGRHRMVVKFRTTYAISAYHHQRCEFESHSGDVQRVHHKIMWVKSGVGVE